MNPATWLDAMQALHFLRPAWLWALLALPLLAWWWRAHRRRNNAWRDAVDAHLLPHLIDSRGAARGYAVLATAALAWLLAIVALAGPSWRQIEQPLWQSRTPLVVALDLSSVSLAGDLPPSRLAQARAKLDQLLRERKGGQVGLVVYAGDAYTVSPLTSDGDNVALFLDALHPDIMPIDGQRADRAIEWSARLLRQAGFERGRILLMTGDVDDDAVSAAAAARRAGYTVSALGLGSEEGAPYRRRDGRLAQAALDAAALRRLVAAGGGQYAALSRDTGDLQSLGVLDAGSASDASAGGGSADTEAGRTWQDGGYWLLPPLMLLALFAFRRRSGTLAVLLVCAWLPWQSVHAAQLWQRPDQIAHQHLERGAQAYRSGDYQRAAKQYRQADTANGYYNLGNALAKAGRYPQAIEAYDKALELHPGMADALANKRAVEQAMKRQPPPSGGQQSKPNQNKSGQNKGAQPQQSGRGESTPEPSRSDAQSDPQSAAKSPPQSESDNAGKTNPSSKPPTEPEAADAQAQQQADRAQRERMQRALERADGAPEQAGPAKVKPAETPEQRERRLANEAWLNRVPDDPGGLLREKFRLEHQRRRAEGGWGE